MNCRSSFSSASRIPASDANPRLHDAFGQGGQEVHRVEVLDQRVGKCHEGMDQLGRRFREVRHQLPASWLDGGYASEVDGTAPMRGAHLVHGVSHDVGASHHDQSGVGEPRRRRRCRAGCGRGVGVRPEQSKRRADRDPQLHRHDAGCLVDLRVVAGLGQEQVVQFAGGSVGLQGKDQVQCHLGEHQGVVVLVIGEVTRYLAVQGECADANRAPPQGEGEDAAQPASAAAGAKAGQDSSRLMSATRTG
jgi:hypothetical protein